MTSNQAKIRNKKLLHEYFPDAFEHSYIKEKNGTLTALQYLQLRRHVHIPKNTDTSPGIIIFITIKIYIQILKLP